MTATKDLQLQNAQLEYAALECINQPTEIPCKLCGGLGHILSFSCPLDTTCFLCKGSGLSAENYDRVWVISSAVGVSDKAILAVGGHHLSPTNAELTAAFILENPELVDVHLWSSQNKTRFYSESERGGGWCV